MGFFTKKTTSYLGVDIGAAGIKVVELRNDHHRPRLSTYGFSNDAGGDDARATSVIADVDATAATLRDICARAKVETKSAIASLPVSAVFSSIITLPQMPDRDLPAAVQWEAKKLFPLPIEEMVVDWKRLTPEGVATNANAAAGKEKVMHILLTGASKALVSQYLAVCKAAGLELVSLETEAFALIRALVGDDPSVVCILDIGAARTSLVIVDRATPVFSRSIEVGGRHITTAIAAAVGADDTAAEEYKLDLAVVPTGNAASAALPALLPSVFAPVIQEVRYAVNLYLSQDEHRGRVVEKVILAGGSALLPSLTEVLGSALNLRVFVGDPWARVVYPVDLRPALDAIGSRFAVAVGLAMREVV